MSERFPDYFVKQPKENLHDMQTYHDPDQDDEVIGVQETYETYSPHNRAIFKEIQKGIFSRTHELTALSQDIANIICKQVKFLDLANITHLSYDTAQILGNHEGRLFLSKLKILEPGVAHALEHHRGALDVGVESLSDEDAEALAKQEGDIRLGRLQSISERGLISLALHKGDVDLPPILKRKLELHKEKLKPRL